MLITISFQTLEILFRDTHLLEGDGKKPYEIAQTPHTLYNANTGPRCHKSIREGVKA